MMMRIMIMINVYDDFYVDVDGIDGSFDNDDDYGDGDYVLNNDNGNDEDSGGVGEEDGDKNGKADKDNNEN